MKSVGGDFTPKKFLFYSSTKDEMIFYIIVMGIIGAIMIALLKGARSNEAVSFSTKCSECGYHKGILKCINCEDRKRDKWR